ncbi:MAG: hypothetical protein DRN20_05005 [Thermoplasmata archaeon]|nr:MAG: hypothetical protein DRN20_05005 [Thermoplasmata archaeon]
MMAKSSQQAQQTLRYAVKKLFSIIEELDAVLNNVRLDLARLEREVSVLDDDKNCSGNNG